MSNRARHRHTYRHPLPTEDPILHDPEPQTASGRVLWHFSMTLDGFIAGPGHSMDWMTGFTGRPGVEEEYVATTGAVLAGRDAFDSAIGDSRPYSDDWQGAIFVLTRRSPASWWRRRTSRS